MWSSIDFHVINNCRDLYFVQLGQLRFHVVLHSATQNRLIMVGGEFIGDDILVIRYLNVRWILRIWSFSKSDIYVSIDNKIKLRIDELVLVLDCFEKLIFILLILWSQNHASQSHIEVHRFCSTFRWRWVHVFVCRVFNCSRRAC